MLFMVGLFVLSGLLGTVLALRLQAIEAQEGRKTILTRKGKIVISLLVGVGVAVIVVLVNGFWWECSPSGVCRYNWYY